MKALPPFRETPRVIVLYGLGCLLLALKIQGELTVFSSFMLGFSFAGYVFMYACDKLLRQNAELRRLLRENMEFLKKVNLTARIIVNAPSGTGVRS